MRSRSVSSLALRLACGLASACGDGSEASRRDAGGSDAGGVPDVPADAGSSDTAGGAPPDAFDAGIDAGGPDRTPIPLPEPEPWTIEDWRVGFTSDDPLALAFLSGDFPFPEELGTDDLGIRWQVRSLDEDGQPPFRGNGTYYLAARIEVDQTVRLVVQLDSFTMSVDGFRVPGDPYRSGRHRLPVVLEPGPHELVLRGSSFRGMPRLRMWRVDSPIFLNLADVTEPDLVVGKTDARPLGVHALNLTGAPLDVEASVEGTDRFAPSSVANHHLPPRAVSQISFSLVPRSPTQAPTEPLEARLIVDSPSFDAPYEVAYSVDVVDGTGPYRWTRRSTVDRSTQYHAVHPPSNFDPDRSYPLVLSLHGASVEAIGQARAYGQKDWLFLVAPTNRRPYGFDWQDWGRLDAIEALDHAMDSLPIDPTRVHLTGHSMGGHGSWHVGVHHTNRFATIGPSAGWVSFFTLGSQPSGNADLERARADSYTRDYYENLEGKAVYIIHGSNDDNIPVDQSRAAFADLQGLVEDLTYHEEDGAGHWWDNDPDTPGAACVDWPPLFSKIRDHTLDPSPLELDFRSPAPSVRSQYGFVTVTAAQSPYEDLRVESRFVEDVLTLSTTNVRAMTLDGDRLIEAGLDRIEVDGEAVGVEPGPIELGRAKKTPGRYGPFKEVFFRPFCFVYDETHPVWAEIAANLSSTWSILGNGRSCAVPFSDRATVASMNRVYLGIPSSELPIPSDFAFEWGPGAIDFGTALPLQTGVVATLFPSENGLSAAVYAPPGSEGLADLLFEVLPLFGSRTALPDYFSLVQQDGRLLYGPLGFFDPDWEALPPR